jgi:NAD+ kinase
MRLGLVVNPQIKDAVNKSYEVIEFLKEKNELFITTEFYEAIKDNIDIKNVTTAGLDEFDSHRIELLITIGGDGTILRALHKCNVKIFGINAGVVGFLTEVHMNDAVPSLKRILNNEYTIDKRVKLETILNDKTLESATNETVIHTSEIAKMRLYSIQVDGVKVQTIRADGIIIATPTGSTSYAMSAGGPILDPKLDAFIIVPIAPFKLSTRPLVVPSNSLISVKLMEPKRKSVLVIDGQVQYEITPNDIVQFTKAKQSAEFIRFEPNFYRLIEEKLTAQ